MSDAIASPLIAPDQPAGEDLSADDAIDLLRIQASRALDQSRRSELGQYFTPTPVSRLMASMFGDANSVDLLDPGAGSGSLLSAVVLNFTRRERRPSRIDITAYEIEPSLLEYLNRATTICAEVARQADIQFSVRIEHDDFITHTVRALRGGFFRDEALPRFSHAILNPPYGKVRRNSPARQLLKSIGVEAGNLYVAFLALAVELLEPEGELVAITPRSFCNGPYFRAFRRWFLRQMAIDRLHVFESRSAAFRSYHVLQENVIIHAVKSNRRPSNVIISTSAGDGDGADTTRTVDFGSVVRPNDPDGFIHIVSDDWGSRVVNSMEHFRLTLDDLGLGVSTGRVVDFRVRELLRDTPGDHTIPLIYPGHFDKGFVRWPKNNGRKPNALALSQRTSDLLVPAGTYVLVRRFSAKEEVRRIVAAVYDSEHVSPLSVGFENHLNYYHANGVGLSGVLARGLAAYLNSTLVDQYFRHFSGHTQVNATDLRCLRYPSRLELERLGDLIPDDHFPSQRELDRLVREELLTMGDAGDPIQAKQRVDEALEVLRAIGLPKAQLNERSALTLLALLDLRPGVPWSEASDPLRGITPIMDFAREHYGKSYAPNTRETVRRQTMHQFVDAGLAIANPDDLERAVNSPDYVYQIENSALELLRGYGSASWDKDMATYLASQETLRARYAQERRMLRVAITMPDGVTLNLTPGGQNDLIKEIIEQFCPRFTPGGVPLYVGDTGEKFAYFDREAFSALGVVIDEHGKMPDVVVHHVDRNWLVIIEAVMSHGPVDPKRQGELKRMFGQSHAGLVFVTAFLSRRAMVAYLSEIAWETEVWVAEDPTHLIHFNGERFLGPY